MKFRFVTLFTVASLVGFDNVLPSQFPSSDVEIESLRDSLSGVTDADGLEMLRKVTQRIADSLRGDLNFELRLGFIDLKLGELTDKYRYWSQASRTLQWVVADHPDQYLAWAGYGMASLGEARTGTSTGFAFQKMLGMDPASKIVDRFVKSAGADSTGGHGIIQVGRLALTTKDPIASDVALRAARLLPPIALKIDPGFALIRIKLEREFGDPDSAVAVADRATSFHPDHPELLRMQAMTRFLAGRMDGPNPWYRGLQAADTDQLWFYLRDLESVVPDSILAMLRYASGDSRVSLVRTFWADQDPDGLPTEDDRLAEHYRRLDFARHNYVRKSMDSPGIGYEVDTLEMAALDDRGKILLSQGFPTKRTSLGNYGGPGVDRVLGIIGMSPNESWLYHRPDGAEDLYHFLALDGQSDFRSVESVFDILANAEQYKRFRPDKNMVGSDSETPTVKTYGAELVSTIAQELMQSRRDLSPVYTEMLNQGRDGADSLQRLERAIGRKSLNLPPSYELNFELPMSGGVDILALGSDSRGPILQISFAVDPSGLTPDRLVRGFVYPLRMRVAVRNEATGKMTFVRDTLRRFVTAARLNPGQYLVGQLPIRVPPGNYRVRASVESGRRGMLTQPIHVTVPRPTGGGMTLSDLSIGIRSVPIPWRAPSADTAWANPLGTFNKSEPMQLYYEVGGLDPGTKYQTRLSVDRLSKNDDGTSKCTNRGNILSIATERTHPGIVDRVHNSLSLARLQEGEYVLSATMTTEDSQTVSRCRRFRIAR